MINSCRGIALPAVMVALVLLMGALAVLFTPALEERWTARQGLAAVRSLAAAEAGWIEAVVTLGPTGLGAIPVGDSNVTTIAYPGGTAARVVTRAHTAGHLQVTSTGSVIGAAGDTAASRSILVLLRQEVDSTGTDFRPLAGPHWWYLPRSR